MEDVVLVLILNIFLGVVCVWEGKQVAWMVRDWIVATCVVEITAVLAVTMWWGATRYLMPVGLVWSSMMRCVTVSVSGNVWYLLDECYSAF
jgi:hypothetical protein